MHIVDTRSEALDFASTEHHHDNSSKEMTMVRAVR